MKENQRLPLRKGHQGRYLQRQWRILRHIHQFRYASLASLAKAFRISPKTAKRDIAILQHAGFPLHVEEEGRLRLERHWCFCGGSEKGGPS